MSYINRDELILRVGQDQYIQYTDRDRDGNEDADYSSVALLDAAGVIDAYLAVKYELPLSSAPAILKRIQSDIAVYFLLNNLGLKLSEEIKQRYKEAIKWLEKIAAGELTIGLSTDRNVATFYGTDKLNTRETLKDMV